MRETRPKVIAHHVALAIRGGMTIRNYAADVAKLYAERTEPAQREVEFHFTRDPYADERANAQIVQRYIDSPRMPAYIEEALVLALPEPFRAECQRELAARYGCLAAAIPSQAEGAELADVGKLMAECGSAFVELAHSYRGGLILPGESKTARKAIDDLNDVIAQAVTCRTRLTEALNQPHQLKRAS